MKCHEFDDRLQALLDDRCDPAADGRLNAHARSCPACRQMLAGQQALFAGLMALDVPPLGGGFSRGVVRSTTGTTATITEPASYQRLERTQRAWLGLAAVAASAAAVLLAVSLVSYARKGPPPAGVPQTSLSGGADTVAVREVPRRRAGVGRGFALANSNLLIEAPRLPQHVRGNYRSAIDNLAMSLPDTVEQLHDVERLAPGIRPIRLTFSRLWEALWGVAPEGEGTNPPRGARHRRPAEMLMAATA